MKISFVASAITTLLLTACGGGGPNAGTCLGSAEVCNAGSSGDTESPSVPTLGKLCGFDVGPQTLTGVVVSVHDGDTARISSGGTEYSIRLDSIRPRAGSTLWLHCTGRLVQSDQG